MKRFLLIIAACFPAIGLLAADVEPMPADTVSGWKTNVS